jgi:hypothetical protein
MKCSQVDTIFSVTGGGEGMNWVAACDVGAKWRGEVHAGEQPGDHHRENEVEEYAHGALGADALTLALFKGLWHTLEPGKGFMSLEVATW